MTRTTLVLALFVVVPPSARADASLTVAVDPAVPIDAGAFRDALARDLDAAVEVSEPRTAQLRISMRDGEAELSYADGPVARTRRVELPTDAAEATESLALIASNLVRDPTDALIGAPPPAAAPTLEPPVEPRPRTAEPPTATPPEEAAADARSFALRRPVRLGLGVLGGAASTPSGVQGYGYFGIDLMGTIHPHLAIGITRLSLGAGFSSVESFLFSLQATPTLEVFAFVDPRVQLFAQVGVALQGRAQTAFREGYFQVAAFVGAGARFWLTDWLTLGVQIGLHVVATDAFVMGNVELPQGSIAGSGGVNLGFSF